MLAVRGLTKRFGGLLAVASVTFDIPQGKVVSLVGPNGAGKTTLFNVISGILKPDGGQVFFGEADVTGWEPHRLAALGLARTFQTVRLFSHLTVLENVMIGRVCRTRAGLLDALLWRRRDRAERREMVERAQELLDLVGLHQKRHIMPHELPYGDQRRVELARALATEPRLLILDEPMAGMVWREAKMVMDLMDRLTGSGLTLLLIEHNMNVVMSVSHKIVVLSFGEKIAEGPPSAIRNDPVVIEAYLGAES